MLIIFHADDFNLTQGVSKGIIKAHQFGVVKSTSVMVNLEGLEESVRLLKENPHLDVGVHINVTFGKPLKGKEVPSLVDDAGVFWRKPNLLKKYAVYEDLKREIEAQLNLALKLGLNITHIDSHHHIHAQDERVMEICINLAKKYHLGLRSIDEHTNEIIRKAHIPTADRFIGYFYGENATFKTIEKAITSINSDITEIMCHPGFADEKLKQISSYTTKREKEMEILTHPKIFQILQKNKAKLVSYKHILNFSP